MKGPSFDEEGTEQGPELRLKGNLNGLGLRIALVASSYNLFITSKLVAGAYEALLSHGLEDKNLMLSWVPGTFEIPLIAQEMAKSGDWDAIVCLGAVIKGETAHFEYVAGEAARGIAQTSRETGIPLAFGVLTTYTEEQALERAGGSSGNKGHDAALAAIESANLLRLLRGL